MKRGSGQIIRAILLGLLGVLPFLIMEVVNLGGFPDPFPYTIFLYLWLMFTLFFIALFALFRLWKSNVRNSNRVIGFILNGLLLVFCAMSALNIILDQMPCFLGVPNCD